MKLKISYKSKKMILEICGIACLIVAGVVENKWATPKAVEAVEKKKAELDKEKLTKMETFKAVAPYHAVTLGLDILGGGILVKNLDNVLKDNAAAVATVGMLEKDISQYKKAITDTVGEETAKTIQSAVSQQKVEESAKKETGNSKEIESSIGMLPGTDGGDIFMEPITLQKFYASQNEINAVANKLNKEANFSGIDSCTSLNDFLYELNLKSPRDDIGDKLVFRTSDGGIDLDFDPEYDEKLGKYIQVIRYRNSPTYDSGSEWM